MTTLNGVSARCLKDNLNPNYSYPTSATYTSAVLDLGSAYDLTTLNYTKTTDDSHQWVTGINVRAGDTSDLSGATWSGNITNGASIAALGKHQYVQYRVVMGSDGSATPTLSDITINYSPAQTLTSSVYDSGDVSNKITQVSWNEDNGTLPTGTTVGIQVQTSANGTSGWTGWCGAGDTTTCSGSNYFIYTNGSNGCTKNGTTVTCNTIPTVISDVSADKFVQYKVTLTSTGANTATLADVTLSYQYNSAPTMNTFASSPAGIQDNSGNVNITYNLSDDAQTTLETLLFYEPSSGLTVNNNNGTPNAGIVDTGTSNITLNNNPKVTLPTAGSVMIDNELINYTGKTEPSGTTTTLTGVSRGQSFNTGFATTGATHATAARTYVKATAASGTGYGTVSATSSPVSKAITWIPKNESNLIGASYATMSLKIIANDGQAYNNISSITYNSALDNFAVDLTLPVISAVAPASSAVINSITSANGGSDISYTLSEAISSGTIVFTRTGGTADGTTHTCTLTGNALLTGAHNNIDLSDTTNSCTAAQSLVSGTIYTMALNVIDTHGNAATQVENTSITFDDTVPVISSVAPATSAIINSITSANGGSDVSYTLSEAIASGTIEFIRTGGTADGASHTCTLTGNALLTGAHNNIDLSDTTNSCTSAQSLVDGTIYTLALNATDPAGNTATQVSNTSITFDTGAPTLSPVHIQSNNPNTAKAKVGDTVTVTFTASETLGSLPTATIATHSASVANTGGNNYFASYTMVTGDTEGTVPFTLNFTDLAGNNGVQVTGTTDSSLVTFDKTLPTLSPVHIQSNNSNTAKAKVGDTITATFTANETLGSLPTVTIATHSATVTNPSGNNYSATFTMVSGDTEGTVPFSIDFSDAANNPGNQVTATTDSSLVTFDRTNPVISATAPTTSSLFNSITSARGGSDVSYTLDEAIQSGTIVFTRTGGVADGTPHICTLTGNALLAGDHSNIELNGSNCAVAPTLVSGTIYKVDFNVTDLAGNTATQVENTALTFDNTDPTSTITAICSTSGDACTITGSEANPQEAYAVHNFSGTANDTLTPLNKVEISIKDTDAGVNKWYSPSTHAFDQTSETWITVNGTGSWSYDTTGINWQLNHLFQIHIQATDNAGNTQVTPITPPSLLTLRFLLPRLKKISFR